MSQKDIGMFIAALRKEKLLTQEQLAEKLGVNSRSVSRWENGHCMPDLSLLGELSDTLGVGIEELLNGRHITKDEMVKIRDSLNKIIELSEEEKNMKTKKMNKYLFAGFVGCVIMLINHQFGILSMIFTKNVDEFMGGLVTGLALLFIIFGLYNNNHSKTFRQRKMELFESFKKS